ncbi:MAG: helix-turn-helix domain-containing protein [Alphaproteobacteria bacterium]|nr:helix-turn-helix domain-containing protein [Alphaproteobacteria bacterium]
MNSGEFLTTNEAAARLRVSARTLERLRVTGLGPTFRAHGRRILYAIGDIDSWSASRSARSTSARAAAAVA